MSIGSKSTRLAPTISHTLLLPLQRPLGFRSPVLFVSPSICRRPPCLDATVLARGEDSTVLFAPVNPCLDTDTLVQTLTALLTCIERTISSPCAPGSRTASSGSQTQLLFLLLNRRGMRSRRCLLADGESWSSSDFEDG